MSATKLLAAKAVLAAVGVTGGGAALAAATGHLPSHLTGTPAAAGPAASATAMSSASPEPTSHPTAHPSPSLRGLCRAYTAHVGTGPGKALESPAFTALITAAGGKDKVTAFCVGKLAVHPGRRRASRPRGKPTSLPPSANTTHPRGKRTTATARAGRPRSRPAI